MAAQTRGLYCEAEPACLCPQHLFVIRHFLKPMADLKDIFATNNLLSQREGEKAANNPITTNKPIKIAASSFTEYSLVGTPL
ncbi:hypothetical protein ALTER154_90243 [Alteromonas sp. 154]|nr:hypothetical protein ALTER154_90243 [Alteromonas sp. 154]